MSAETLQRIEKLHAWFVENVMPIRLTPEVQRLWLEWIRAGFNGHDLRDVIRYVRRQISLGKRNEGALKLSNLFSRDESGGFLRFEEDLGLARARANLNVDKRLAPATDGEAGEAGRSQESGARSQKVEPAARTVSAAEERAFAEFQKMKEKL